MSFPAIAAVITTLTSASTAYNQKRGRDAQKAVLAEQEKSLAALAPGAGDAGADAEKAKAEADRRAKEREQMIAARTRSLASTIQTSNRGLLSRPPTEKKTLLGQGGRV